jgi:hypothetical protein
VPGGLLEPQISPWRARRKAPAKAWVCPPDFYSSTIIINGRRSTAGLLLALIVSGWVVVSSSARLLALLQVMRMALRVKLPLLLWRRQPLITLLNAGWGMKVALGSEPALCRMVLLRRAALLAFANGFLVLLMRCHRLTPAWIARRRRERFSLTVDLWNGPH